MMEGDRTSGGKRAIGHTDVAVESRAPVINKYPPHAVGSCRVRHALWHLLGLAFRRQPHHGGPSSHGPTNALPAPGVDGSPAECGAQQAERAEAAMCSATAQGQPAGRAPSARPALPRSRPSTARPPRSRPSTARPPPLTPGKRGGRALEPHCPLRSARGRGLLTACLPVRPSARQAEGRARSIRAVLSRNVGGV